MQRLFWQKGRQKRENRAAAVLDRILASGEENVLIVGHGAFMMFMRKELLKRGFRGPALHRPVHGQLYVYER
ncbi:histidine phosphatase family protein [Brevibacillus composti]|uniref:Histidine phosphatase family protein n=1 Tax=Brevibacillus composti TaxID=2796470 RepID=A0A7T5EJ53_9BACL|nr:histidine phosphatase family protein [Brevibacillus composti]QQE73488.1 histidine phosphatase family protein [Brevibacillus composti]QUO40570.1 histidine phosphatase family protein [Brevibacillus composti]